MSLPPLAVRTGRAALRASLEDLPGGSLVAVACSGGADSLAVAATLAFVGRHAGWRTAAFLIDHNMQAGSADVTQRAAQQCRDLGLESIVVKQVDVAQGPAAGGPEAAARTARYAALDELAREHGASAVLLGHTIDDQAETVLLGLARGSGARSLAGMRARKGVYRRPFLTMTRADTEAICAHEGLSYWTDPTNVDVDGPLRSQVRGRVLPLLDDVLGPGITSTLARTAEQLHEDADLLEQLGVDALERAIGGQPGDNSPGEAQITLSVEVLSQEHRAARTRALRQAAILAGSPAGTLARRHIDEVDRLLTHWHGQGPIHLPGPVFVRRQSGNLVLSSHTVD